MSIVIAVIIFGLIVLIHEYGHFIAARKCGVMVEEFAMGMGPKLLQWQRGETLFSLRLLPIGGFCKMLGEDTESGDSRALNNKSLPGRALILSAGALMNFVLAFVLFLLLVMFSNYKMAQVQSVLPNSPAEAAGLMPGDTIIRMNGTRIFIYEDLAFEKSTNRDKPARLEILRGKEKINLTLTPRLEEGQYNIGFYADARAGIFSLNDDGLKRAGVGETIQNAFFRIFFYIRVTFISLVRLVTLQLPMSDMAGPIGMVTLISDTYTQIVEQVPSLKHRIISVVLDMTHLCAILSANLGVFNLLPLPALDGGRLVFVLFEAIRKKPVPAEKEGFVHFVGFVLLMILAVVIAYSDIRKLI